MNRDEVFLRANSIEGWFQPEDMKTMWNLVMEKVPENGLVVEVGSWKGRSSFVIGAACKTKNARVICIDTFKGLVDPGHEKWKLYHGENGYYKQGNEGSILFETKENLEALDNITLWEGSSTELYKKLKNESADLIFLDGDHDMPVLGQDLKNFYPKLKPGGYYCGHDYEVGNNVATEVDKMFPQVELRYTIWGVTKPLDK